MAFISQKFTPVRMSLLAILLLGSATACTVNSQPNPSSSSPAMQKGGMNGMHHSGMGGMSMDLGPADANLDLRFIDAMIPHHQGAVDMAKTVQQNSKRSELLNLAKDIIQAQNKEIAQMRQWRKAWYPNASDTPMIYDTQMGHMMAMSPEQMRGMMMQQDLGAADAQFDLRFINAMIPHHEGAITMAKEVLRKTKRPEIQQMAQAIITSQQAEIEQMNRWRKAWYGR